MHRRKLYLVFKLTPLDPFPEERRLEDITIDKRRERGRGYEGGEVGKRRE